MINDSRSVSTWNGSDVSVWLDLTKTFLIFKCRESRTSLFPWLFGICLFSVVIVDEISHNWLSNSLRSSWT